MSDSSRYSSTPDTAAVPARHPATMLAVVATLLATVIFVLVGTERPAEAATIQEVTGFGSNPGNLQMFRYVPAGLPAGRPLVVVMHGCTQNAAGYGTNSGWTRLADAWGFALVLPQQQFANNSLSCFNWFQAGDTARGSGEPLSVKQMVDRMKTDFGSTTSYVTGLSAGGAMAAVMLATYPDIFAGGGIVAGLPYGCAPANPPATCQDPGVNLTPAQWGDKVRAASSVPSLRPKVSIWHGTADTTVKPANLTELVDQWTNVLGTSRTPDVSDTVGGYPHKVYGSVVESYEITGMAHGQPIDPGTGATQCGNPAPYILDVNICAAYYIGRFWGLGGGSTTSPPTTPSTTSPAISACFTGSNYAQVAAGRAHTTGGLTYANGSDQAMGLYNIFTSHTLKENPPGYFAIADGGCP